jgi:hypothetical protein
MSRKVELSSQPCRAVLHRLAHLRHASRARPRQQVRRLVRERDRPDFPSSAIVAEDCRLVRLRVRPVLSVCRRTYGFFRSKQWLPYLLLPLAGMVATSTGIYMVTDATGDVRPLNWAVFYLLNGPYIVVPVLAAIWLTARTRKPVTAATRTAC